jgi:hypothetical protein
VSADYDSPWKEALDVYFEAFLALLFPEVHGQIDWSRGYESLDKEFQQVVREAQVRRQFFQGRSSFVTLGRKRLATGQWQCWKGECHDNRPRNHDAAALACGGRRVRSAARPC